MRLIVGLGNPGPRYARTRHNLGFMAADEYAESMKASWKPWGQARETDLAQITLGAEKIIAQKPMTFMNASGQAVVATAHFFKVLPEEICVIHDDLDLPLGTVRLKVGGGDGGHNGLKSVTKSLATSEYARIRLGIGRPPHSAMDPADYVLQPFADSDWPAVDDMIQLSLRCVAAFVEGLEAFSREMNVMNKREK